MQSLKMEKSLDKTSRKTYEPQVQRHGRIDTSIRGGIFRREGRTFGLPAIA